MNVGRYNNADRESKYELMFLRFFWTFIFICILCVVLPKNIFKFRLIDPIDEGVLRIVREVFLGLVLIYQLLKHYAFKRGYFKRALIRYIDKLLGLFIVSFFITYVGVGLWAFNVILFTILMITLARGTKTGVKTVAYSFLIHVALLFSILGIRDIDRYIFTGHVSATVFFYMTALIFVNIFGTAYNDNKKSEEKEAYLLKKLENNCSQLKKSNKRLAGKVAELFTLQQITKAISSILDIKDLLKYVNDIIIGVMGVPYSTIILYDQNTGKFKVHTTNINNGEELEILNENINSDCLREVLKSGKALIENNLEPEKYSFTKDRGIKSIVCMPLSTKTGKVGVVLVEHKLADVFTEENVNFLDIISQQVGIAIENAQLYQKLQDMAYIDSLTGVYSRDYFNELLKNEFRNAVKGGYKLSLAIYDVDNFKIFNDTYGHLFGDEILKRIAWTIKAYIRKGDIFARFGGEEFVILFPRTDLEEAYEIAERLRVAVANIPLGEISYKQSVTLSFGVSCFDDCATNEIELISTADDALYKAKASGRNCVKKAELLKVYEIS
ncbi:MAG TPA: diguanylate cyclase [Clostridiaceae bacterium]|nr:diguanylate cyclase [Clostridiaceae bacterium]